MNEQINNMHGSAVLAVDSSICQAHGRCYDLYPDLFAPDDLGYSVVANPFPQGRSLEEARSATLTCPERAISLAYDEAQE